jgi:hypothetical protein
MTVPVISEALIALQDSGLSEHAYGVLADDVVEKCCSAT